VRPENFGVTWRESRIVAATGARVYVDRTMAVQHEDELRREIAAGRVTVIVGAGVSIAATGAAATASWIGLLTDGIDRCASVVPGLPGRWADRMHDLLDLGREGDTEALLSVAEQITVKLGGASGGEMKRWLRETVGALHLRHPDVPRTLGGLGAPLLTTNYDDILEEATHRRALDWRDTADVERVLRGEDNAIVHLHGYWRRSENLVLGVRSYEDVLRNTHAQTVLRALRMTKTLLFVGFGAGLDDPNFGALLRWTREVFASSEVRHYRLARADEVEAVQAQHKPEERVFVLSYGERHADLALFLAGLTPARHPAALGLAPAAAQPDATSRPRILVAGPFFGVPRSLRPDLLRIWNEDSKKENAAVTQARIRAKLGSAEVRQAQLAAILRYDVILDLSPWRAFSSRWSLGLRDVQREPQPREGRPVPLLYMVHSGTRTPKQRKVRADLLLLQLRAAVRQFPDLGLRIEELIDSGVAVSGFDARDFPEAILAFFPRGPIVSDAIDLGSFPSISLAPKPLDARTQNPSLDDYLRALRINAGQVTLAGETAPRPISDVYVELEIHRDEERRAESGPSEREAVPGTIEALREEVEARRKAAWDLPGSEVIPASAIHEVARRILLWGPAGTGKSTLLRHLACKVADEGRIPLWIPRMVELGDDLPEALAMRALQAVGLPDGPSPARTQLREAVESGHAFLFLDGFDEAPTAVRRALPQRIRDLPTEMRVVIASRPLHRMHTGLVEITLTGLPVNGAEELLGAYFKDAPWIQPLLHALELLPDGTAWARNPVLLGLAASVYRNEKALPDATLALYKKVIDSLLAPLAHAWPIDAVWVELKLLARNMLLPRTGDATVTVREGDLPYAYREALLASGLFTGDEWLRFTHLTLGEYLAASSLDFDFAAERARERNRPEGRAEEASALEVLPMAHALFSDETELVNAFRDARDLTIETPGHRMLRLVLRAIGYGGKAARAFCEKKSKNEETWAEHLIAVLADRLQASSGRFGDFERQLMDDAERALVLVARFVSAEAGAKIRAQFAPVLATRGEVGTEAHIALWNLGLQKPSRRSSRWWPTIERQARALVRAGFGVDELFELTEGADRNARMTAVDVLAPDEEYWPELRPLFDDPSLHVRRALAVRLANFSAAEPYIREQLYDDEGIVRRAAADALAVNPKQDSANFERLLAGLDDSDVSVQQCAIRYAKDDMRARSKIRDFLRDHLTWIWNSARDEAIGALVQDLESRSLIREFLESPKRYHSDAFSHLVGDAEWQPLLLKRLDRDDPETGVIEALAGHEVALPRMRMLLDDANESVRVAVVTALAKDSKSRRKIVELLGSSYASVRDACVDVLADDPGNLPLIEQVLLHDEEHNPRHAAIKALARYPARKRDLLWRYFDSAEQQEWSYDSNIRYDLLRATVVRELGNDPGSMAQIVVALNDRSESVRKEAVRSLAEFEALHGEIERLTRDKSSAVREAAFVALKDDRTVRERLRSDLKDDDELVCIVGLKLLVRQGEPRHRLRQILLGLPGRRRSTVVQPLAYDVKSRELLYACLGDKDKWVRRAAILVLKRVPEARRRLRDVLENEQSLAKSVYDFFSWEHIAQILAEDPDTHPLLFERVRESKDQNLQASIVPIVAHYPKARGFLREQLNRKDIYPNLRAAVIRALAGDTESLAASAEFLNHKDRHVRAAAVEALAQDASSTILAQFRTLLAEDPAAEVRRAALAALANDDEAKEVIRSRIDRDDDPEVRMEMIKNLTGDPQAHTLLRDRLRDRTSTVRLAAASALRIRPVQPAVPLKSHPSVRLALHIAGNDPAPDAPLPALALRDRLEAFVKAPRAVNLDNDLPFAEAILGWICARLCWAAEDGAFRNGRVFGEVKEHVNALLGLDELVIRVAMDSSELPRERFLHPAHNVIEAWQVATHLYAERPPAFFLVCADVDFEHLVPPTLAPGQVFWGSGFFGFRLRKGKPEAAALDPLELLVSGDARAAWQGANEETQARYLEMMSRLANLASLDPWALVPVLSRVGDLLPLSVRAAFAQRLPRAMVENVLQLELASRSLGTHESAPPPVAPPVPVGVTESAPSAAAELQAALDIVRGTLDGSGPIDAAIDAFEQGLGALVSSEVYDADRDDAVMLLDGLRDRMTTYEQAKRVLVVAVKIDDTMLSRGTRRRLYDLRSWLRTWRA
jgi:HEAT repeat protein